MSFIRNTALVLIALLLLAGAAWAQEEPAGEKEDQNQEEPAQEPMIQINWEQGVQINDVIEWASRLTKKRILYDGKLQGQLVFARAENGIPLKYVWAWFESVLEMNGYTMVEYGPSDAKWYKVVVIQNAAQKPVRIEKVNDFESLPEDEQIVSQIYILEYIQPRDVQSALMNLVSNPRSILPIDSANAVLLTDLAPNVRRIGELITMMDVKGPDIEFEMVKLKYATSDEIEPNLRTLVQTISTGGSTRRPRPGQANQNETIQIVGDSRTNSIIVLAEPDRMIQIKDLITKLDAKVPFRSRSIHVKKLKNADATEMASALNDIFSQLVGDTSRTNGRPTQIRTPGQPGAGGNNNNNQPGVEEIPPRIVADTQNNALIVVADEARYKDIESVIEQLDLRPPQVLIETHIIEVTGEENFDLGTELAHIPQSTDGTHGFGGTRTGLSTLLDNDGDGIPESKVPVDTAGITLGVFKDTFGEIPVLLQAFGSNRVVNVRSAPEVVVNNNQQATLEITDQFPTTTTTIGAGGQQITTFNGFQDAGISLDISPHITEQNTVRLEASVQVNQFSGDQVDPSVPPPRVTRNLTTNVTVPNSRTLVIGGLTVENESDVNRGVPFLKDIPILGYLFSRETKTKNTTSLYIFITPYILYDYSFGDYGTMSDERRDIIEGLGGKVEGFQQGENGLPVLPYGFIYRPPIMDEDTEADLRDQIEEERS